ncbi:MAG: RsmD family RNA methyltransferase [Synergistaceae bacterium]|jgi:16S rRNA (guanine(966)-N(2))-methyltransferase RsmD|nr:RsmD family RNA methyltransferase [Synergistaceae bacterium]
MSGNIRPTSGKVALALFNILGARGFVDGVSFLDLFSGTGGIALGALERGAARVVAVESDRILAGRISAAMRERNETGIASCLCGDVRRIVPRLAKENREAGESDGFDVIFADPPYCMGWGEELPRLIEANVSLIAPGGVLVFERSSRERPADIIFAHDDRIYGETVLSFYWSETRGEAEI